jgi:hypothetical protein
MGAQPSFIPDGSGIVVTDVPTQRLVRVTAAGARAGLLLTDGGTGPAVSPRGDQVAFVQTGSNGIDALMTVPLYGGSAARLATTGSVNSAFGRPVWSPNADAIAVPTSVATSTNRVTIWRAPSGSLPASLSRVDPAQGLDVWALAWRRLDEAAPSVTFTGAPGKTPGAVSIPVQVTDDTVPVGGLTVSCAVDAKAVAGCTSGYTGTLASGSHTLTVTAADPHGHSTTTSYRWTVDATPPTVTLGNVASMVLGTAVTVGYSGADAGGISSFDVRYRAAAYSAKALSSYVYPSTWVGTTAKTRTLALAAGSEYCFSVRAHDTQGNHSAWSAEKCTSRPLDDRSLAAATSGWTRSTASWAYSRTVTRTTTAGAKLTRSGSYVRRLSVVATTCPTCGSVDVYVGSARVGTISLWSATTKNAQVKSLALFSSVRYGAVTLRSTKSAKPVTIDGLSLRKT